MKNLLIYASLLSLFMTTADALTFKRSDSFQGAALVKEEDGGVIGQIKSGEQKAPISIEALLEDLQHNLKENGAETVILSVETAEESALCPRILITKNMKENAFKKIDSQTFIISHEKNIFGESHLACKLEK